MRLSICVLGTEVLVIETGMPQPHDDRGDCTTYPVGFTRSPGDQRWERAAEMD